MMYPLVRELAAGGTPVAVTCRVLTIARQPYYRWCDAPVTGRDWVQAHRTNALVDAHGDDPEFGYRFLADEARIAGWPMSRQTAWSLATQTGLASTTQRHKRGKNTKAGLPVFDDLVQRLFTAASPNQVWLRLIHGLRYVNPRTTMQALRLCSRGVRRSGAGASCESRQE